MSYNLVLAEGRILNIFLKTVAVDTPEQSRKENSR